MLARHLWRDFLGVTSSVAVLGLGVGSSLPLTALVLKGRGFGPEVVGWMAAATALGGVVSTLVCPRLTLRFGRRTVMLVAVATAAASVTALQLIDSLVCWAALRAVFGAAMAPLFVIGEAWITSLPDDAVRGRVVAIYATSFTLCQVMGPLLTDWMVRFPTNAFLICGALFLLGIPGIALARDASAPAAPAAANAAPRIAPKDSAASWLGILRAAPSIIVGAGLFAAFDTTMLSFLPLFALDRGATRTAALTALMIVFAGDSALQFAVGWLADHVGHARVHRLSGWMLCILLPLLPFMIALPGWWELYLFGLGGIAGSVYTLSIVLSGARFSGPALLRASGLIALTWSLASSVGPAATGIVMEHLGSSWVTAVLSAMAVGFVLTTG